MTQKKIIDVEQGGILKDIVMLLYALMVLFVPSGFFAQTWVARYDGPGNGYDAATALAVDEASNVYVTGYSVGPVFTNDYATVKYDSLGNELWVVRYNAPDNGDDVAFDMELDNAGNIYVTGYSADSSSVFDYATVKYDSSGAELWVARYNGPGNDWDRANALAIDENSNIYVTGFGEGLATDNDYATVKYDSAGNELWVARYNGPGNYHDAASDVVLDAVGNVYVTGNSSGLGTYADFATVKYDSAGNELWVARYNGPAGFNDEAAALVIDDLHNTFVTGFSADPDTIDDIVTVKYDSAGNELWVSRYNGPLGGYDRAYALVLDSGCNVYVAGYSYGIGTEADITTVKYDSAGNELWVARYNGPGNGSDVAFDIALDDSGNIYVTGFSRGLVTFGDYVVVKYDSAGGEQWVAFYNGPGDNWDVADEITLDNAGNVYVTGCSVSSGINFDYATLKYSSTGVVEDEGLTVNAAKNSLSVFPNPFHRFCDIRYAMTDNTHKYELKIYDVTGRLVVDVSRQMSVIDYQLSVKWDGTDDAGNRLPGGIYFVACRTGNNQEMKQLILIR
ncbi:hypothetical protein AMJ83_01630 [candidate division WOR_3 bacterium SM23_42]|uniref:Secretion system C-terminal sorting domain-containing protein n=1 Tax=candidate division WOR_3 bacterium SM23_42 TaxID=1703779 RepID=A0A0S8FUS0_UNCW3|nr:MAG: hypothetical protein AMJ83_01630 [candidate division WOR_3 bacterium SM23_42]